MTEHHVLMGGKLHLYKRGGTVWHCSAYLAGKNRRVTTKEDSLSRAKEIAEDWYLELRGKRRRVNLAQARPSRRPPTNSLPNTKRSPRASAARNG